MNHHLLNRSLLCHFTLCSRPLSVANVNNGCDKPCASYLTLHLSDLNRLRWVILACGISSETLITKPNCTMVPGGGSFAISEVPRRCSMGYSTLSTVARAVCGLHLTLGSPVWGRLRKEMCYTVTQWSLEARRCLLRMGPRYGRLARSVNGLRWLRLVCVDIRALWCPAVSITVLVWSPSVSIDPIGVWGEYVNPLTAWFL